MRIVAGVVVEAPIIYERAVEFGEVADAAMESAPLDLVRDVVAPFCDALAHAITGNVEVGNPEKIELDKIAGGAEITQERGIGAAGERGSKDEIFATRGQFAEAAEHDAAGFEGGAIGAKGARPAAMRSAFTDSRHGIACGRKRRT